MRTFTRTGALVLALLLALCPSLQPVLAEEAAVPPTGTEASATPQLSGDGDNSTTPPPGNGDNGSTPPSGNGDNGSTPPSGNGDNGSTPPSGNGDNGSTPPSGNEDNGSTPPSGNEDNGSTPPLGNGDNGSTPPSGNGDNGSTPPSGNGDNGSTPPSGNGDNSSTPSFGNGDNGSTPPSGNGDNSSAQTPAGDGNRGSTLSSPEPNGGLTPEPTSVPQPDTVSTWAELTAWLDNHWQTGGTVHLDADVTADGTYDLMSGKQFFRMKPMTIDCGEHTIYIENRPGNIISLTASNFNLTIRGRGGPAGLLQVLSGGTLTLDMLNIEAEEDAAVIQAEGAVLIVTQEDLGYMAPPRVTGEIVYAQRPVLTSQEISKLYLAVVPDGQPLTEDLLPPTVKAALNYRGQLTNFLEQPAAWDLETDRPQLERRERTILTGRPVGELSWNGRTWAEGEYEVHGQPVCVAAFLEGGAALLELDLEHTSQVLFGPVYFHVEPGAETLRLMTSIDGGITWSEQATLTDTGEAETDRGQFMLYLDGPTYPVWLLVEAVYPDGRIVHTDTVSIDEDQVRPAAWVDGHRGGGEPILPTPDTDAMEPPPAEEDPSASQQPDNSGSDDSPSKDVPTEKNPPVSQQPDNSNSGDSPSKDVPTGEEPHASQQPDNSSSGDSPSKDVPTEEKPPVSKPTEDVTVFSPAVDGTEPDSVQRAESNRMPDTPESTAQPTIAGQEEPGGLSTAAQIALGGTAGLALGVGTVFYFNPKPVRKLLQKLSKLLYKK